MPGLADSLPLTEHTTHNGYQPQGLSPLCLPQRHGTVTNSSTGLSPAHLPRLCAASLCSPALPPRPSPPSVSSRPSWLRRGLPSLPPPSLP
ncbi:uncharacterized protein DS421_16g539260 [Arachis hypogaea]|nr:uncharacterized protein DS421_16g539260 [Arachis hypogaea]